MRATVLQIVLLLSAAAADSKLSNYQGCWRTDRPDADITNTITLCFEENRVATTIYYPNDGRIPTICRSTGVISVADSGELLIQTNQGACENTRVLAETYLSCTLLSENELNCLHPDGEQIRVWRESSLD